MARAATGALRAALLVTASLVSTVAAVRAVDASPAQDLGDAYRAYDAGELARAATILGTLDARQLANDDYLHWLRGMVALRTGKPAEAKAAFVQLGKLGSSSRYARELPWRLADCAWDAGDRQAAAKLYSKLVGTAGAGEHGDTGTARFRIAETRAGTAAAAAYRAFLIEHPAHPLAPRAERRLAALKAAPITAAERIRRAQQLTAAHLWDEAVAELSLLGGAQPAELARQRDYWLGVTLFKMRRRYAEAGTLLLRVYAQMGASAPEAMFHGARALSRADRDDEAIRWYQQVVQTYPATTYAAEAQFLSGWLELNRGKYREAIPPLEATLAKYPTSKWVDDALWNLGLAHYFLGEWEPARTRLAALAKRGGSLEGGKGAYWLARLDEKLGKRADSIAGYTAALQRHPFSWYALLARARLDALGVKLGPFGDTAAQPAKPRGNSLAATVDAALAKDDLIVRADELVAAKLVVEAGYELARGERAFLKRHDRSAAFAMLLDRYKRAANFNRPWMLAIVHNGGALDGPAPPNSDARRWWTHAYPRAFQALIEKHQHLGKNPEGYLYSIMRKESGFDPHILSYADAQGLLQMIPATTRRVAKELALPYDAGRLYEPEYNIQTASWYIGHMLQKFKGQIPIGAGSFNSGPRPVMKWLDQHGTREIDELVELVPYTQTREYMKKVTENYARYRYLYQGEIYLQPLAVDAKYLDDRLTY